MLGGKRVLDGTGFGDGDLGLGSTRRRAKLLDRCDNVQTLDNFAKDDVFAV